MDPDDFKSKEKPTMEQDNDPRSTRPSDLDKTVTEDTEMERKLGEEPPTVCPSTKSIHKDSKKEDEGKGKEAERAQEVSVYAYKYDNEDKVLRSFDFFHGYLPREDLPYLLRVDGDFILRISEVAPTNESPTAYSMKLRSKIQWDIILSCAVLQAADFQNAETTRVRNIIVRRKSGQYYLELNRVFDGISELIDFYKTQQGKFSNFTFLLKNGIKLQHWEFMHSAVVLKNILGEGAFGEVRRGTLRYQKKVIAVAVKLTKGAGELSKAKIREMMKEARLMRNFRHTNVVRIYGVAVDEEPLYIILEFVKGGALNTYLQKHPEVDITERIGMCHGAARGLAYLHSKNCIHRDIAARNCLYSNSKVVKLSDFGLSRMGSQYKLTTHCKLPIKWLAPETITTLYFTHKTDAYSYGVMCFEVFSNGAEPWGGVTNTETKKNVCNGKFLRIPENCPESVRAFIHDRLFVRDPEKRPTMKEVAAMFESVTERKSLFIIDKENIAEVSSKDRKKTSLIMETSPRVKPSKRQDSHDRHRRKRSMFS
ncbi:unnamed protein product [Caenorhabditis auriculariae]|uniref:Tyrosine-protein kinase n=1 Tax=Caenorhabditis auriculariae TaxID=2777116 RepID=A0A8S1HJK9_9PELO|nr:unnamed protein product [Caenorhabditis auriculariae]